MLESLRLNKATLLLSTIWAGKLFQTLILRQTKKFRRQFILECSLNILKLWPLVRDVSQSMILKSRSHSILTKPRIMRAVSKLTGINVSRPPERKYSIEPLLVDSEYECRTDRDRNKSRPMEWNHRSRTVARHVYILQLYCVSPLGFPFPTA